MEWTRTFYQQQYELLARGEVWPWYLKTSDSLDPRRCGRSLRCLFTDRVSEMVDLMDIESGVYHPMVQTSFVGESEVDQWFAPFSEKTARS